MGKLFGTSGIRAVINEQLTPDLAIKAGLALGTYLENKGKVIIGRDTRTSGEMLEHAVSSGLLAAGCDVLKIGVAPTPTTSFSTKYFQASAGVIITASHNPPEYNGIKFFNNTTIAFTPEQEEKIEPIILNERYKLAEWDKVGKAKTIDTAIEAHIKTILSHIKACNGLEIVVDCGNGATSLLTPFLLKDLGCKVIALNAQPDGFFPGRSPEPIPENLQNLIAVIKATNADLGIAHDGDGDRIVVIDERGNFVSPDRLFALIASNVIKENKGGTIVTTVDASMCIDEAVNKVGGKIIKTKVGDTAVALSVCKHNGILGGEPSGTFIIPEINLCPDAPLAAAKIIELLCKTKAKISDLLKGIPEYPILRSKISCPQHIKERIMNKLKTTINKVFPNAQIEEIDGLRLNLKDSWIIVRPSGTEPVIRLAAEAQRKKEAEELMSKVSELVKKEIQMGSK